MIRYDDPAWVESMLSLCKQHESELAPVDKFRVGAVWRSKQTKRTRIIVEVNGDDVITRFENSSNYYRVPKGFLEALYSYVM